MTFSGRLTTLFLLFFIQIIPIYFVLFLPFLFFFQYLKTYFVENFFNSFTCKSTTFHVFITLGFGHFLTHLFIHYSCEINFIPHYQNFYCLRSDFVYLLDPILHLMITILISDAEYNYYSLALFKKVLGHICKTLLSRSIP